MQPGDPVWIRHLRGDIRDEPGVFVRATRQRVTIRVWETDEQTRDRTVSPKHVRPRINADDIEHQIVRHLA